MPQGLGPGLPGAPSALGILAGDVVKDYSRTVLWIVAEKLPHTQIDHEFEALGKKAAQDFHQEAWQGRVHYQRTADLRYHGQGYELNIPFTRNLIATFQKKHTRPYA